MILYFLVFAQAPSFTLQDLDKNEVVLDSLLLKNKLVVIGFWATWCKCCITELDAWKRLSEKFKLLSDTSLAEGKVGVGGSRSDGIPSEEGVPANVTFVAINEDGPRTRSQVPLMVKSHKWEFLILKDDGKVMKLFQVKVMPHTFIIGKDREILYQHVGFAKKDEEILYKELESLLKPTSDTLELEKPEESE